MKFAPLFSDVSQQRLHLAANHGRLSSRWGNRAEHSHVPIAETYPSILAVVLVACWALDQAAADPPDILRNYRFITDKSTVEVTGGIAGIDWPLNILGRFGLVSGYNYGTGGPTAHAPTLEPFAQFIDVQAILFDPRRASPLPSPGWDLDKTLNLSGLNGTFTDPRQLHFSGVDGQGQPIKLQATLAGRLLHLTGANDPTCCDFFHYKVDAYAHLTPYADFNFDGAVDAADFTVWRDHVGQLSGTTLIEGDADGDGDVDGDDYIAWQGDVGTVTDMSAFASAVGGATAVPEPATWVLLVGIGAMAICSRRYWHPRMSV